MKMIPIFFMLFCTLFLLSSCNQNDTTYLHHPTPGESANISGTTEEIFAEEAMYKFASENCGMGISLLDTSTLLNNSFLKHNAEGMYDLILRPEGESTTISFIQIDNRVKTISSIKGAQLTKDEELLLSIFLDSIEKIDLVDENLTLESTFIGFCNATFTETTIDPLDPDGDGILNSQDCAPNDPLRWRHGIFFRDLDEDGWFSEYQGFNVCYGEEIPEGYGERGLDCDDYDPHTNPEGIEIYDNRDNNCNGRVDEDLIFWR